MAEIKYTILPPQKAPTLMSAYRRPASLGEHQAAFLNSNNRYGFQVDEIPEEPIVDEMAGLFLTVLYNLPKLSRSERKREAAQHYRKMVKAGFMFRNGVWVKQEPKPAPKFVPTPEIAAKYVKGMGELIDQLAGHNVMVRKHIVATRTHFSYKAEHIPGDKLRDDEYQARLAKLRKDDPDFLFTINLDEMMFAIPPKADPTGWNRINPYL